MEVAAVEVAWSAPGRAPGRERVSDPAWVPGRGRSLLPWGHHRRDHHRMHRHHPSSLHRSLRHRCSNRRHRSPWFHHRMGRCHHPWSRRSVPVSAPWEAFRAEAMRPTTLTGAVCRGLTLTVRRTTRCEPSARVAERTRSAAAGASAAAGFGATPRTARSVTNAVPTEPQAASLIRRKDQRRREGAALSHRGSLHRSGPLLDDPRGPCSMRPPRDGWIAGRPGLRSSGGRWASGSVGGPSPPLRNATDPVASETTSPAATRMAERLFTPSPTPASLETPSAPGGGNLKEHLTTLRSMGRESGAGAGAAGPGDRRGDDLDGRRSGRGWTITIRSRSGAG